MQRVDEDYYSKLHGTLSSVRMVNKTDVKSLSMNFGSLKNVVLAQKEVRDPQMGTSQDRIWLTLILVRPRVGTDALSRNRRPESDKAIRCIQHTHSQAYQFLAAFSSPVLYGGEYTSSCVFRKALVHSFFFFCWRFRA